jgi:magnesium transporter
VDAVEDDADELDSVALRDEGRRELLADLVAIRQRVARLRRLLAAHRDIYASLGAADAAEITGGADSAAAFKAVASRFASAVAAVDDAREAVLGSFEIYMTRTAQRTNDVMKILALATVLLLPGSMIAGLLGMNVVVPLDKDDPMSFWIVIIGVATLAIAVLGLARKRDWL